MVLLQTVELEVKDPGGRMEVRFYNIKQEILNFDNKKHFRFPTQYYHTDLDQTVSPMST